MAIGDKNADSKPVNDKLPAVDNVQEPTITGDLLRSIGYSVENQYNGAAQLANKVSGSHLGMANWVDAPEKADFGSARWAAQQIGTGIGMLPLFWATNKVVGSGLGLLKVAETAETVSLVGDIGLSSRAFTVGQTALSGALYEGTFRPSDSKEGFWTSRGLNATTGLFTFGSMSLAHGSLGGLPEPVKGILSGTAGGFANAEVSSALHDHRPASWSELSGSMLTYGAAGGLLSPLGSLGKDSAAKGPGKAPSELRTESLAEGLPKTGFTGRSELEMTDQSLPTDAASMVKQAASDYVSGTRLLHENKVTEAVQSLERSLRGRSAALGTEHPQVADTLDTLSDAYMRSGSDFHPIAESYLARAAAIRRAAFGPQSTELAGTLTRLSNSQATQLKYVDAADSMHEALGIYDHLSETGAMDNLAAKDYGFSRWQMYANAAKMYEMGGQVEKSAELLKKAGQQTAPLEPPPPPPGDRLK